MTGYEVIPPEERKWKYRLTEPLTEYVGILGREVRTEFIHLAKDGWLTLAVGYAWDGMSWIVRDTLDSMERSAVHDALYQLGRLGLLPPGWRKIADSVFLRMGLKIATKQEWPGWRRRWKAFRAWYTWLGVRIGGGMWNRRAAAKE